MKQATGTVFLAFSLLQSLQRDLVLYTQDSKPKSNTRILGKKPNLLQYLPQTSPNVKKNQQDVTDFIKSGLWPELNTLVGIILEYQPPAFLLRNCCYFVNNLVNTYEESVGDLSQDFQRIVQAQVAVRPALHKFAGKGFERN